MSKQRYSIVDTNNIYDADKPIETPFRWCIWDNEKEEVVQYVNSRANAVTIKNTLLKEVKR